MQQNIFKPNVVIIDGLKFDESGRGLLVELREMAQKYAMRIWFTVHTHRHEPPKEDGLPLSFLHVADLFDVLVLLAARGPEVYIKALGDNRQSQTDELLLDPATMLINKTLSAHLHTNGRRLKTGLFQVGNFRSMASSASGWRQEKA
jgi:hypothetical protein